MVMEAWTTFLYSSPLWIYLYSTVWLKKENNYSPKLWFFVLCPHHSTPKFASTYLQQGVQLCCRCFKTSIFQTMPAEHTEIFSEGTVATSRKRKNKRKVGGAIQADVCWIFPMALCLQRTFPKEVFWCLFESSRGISTSWSPDILLR